MTTRKTTRAAEKAMPAALVALAARIDMKAHMSAVDIYERIANSLRAIMERQGVTPEVLLEVIGMLNQDWPETGQSQVLVEFARERIIAELIKIDMQEEQQ